MGLGLALLVWSNAPHLLAGNSLLAYVHLVERGSLGSFVVGEVLMARS
jgi:hypothetical protein